MSDRLTKTLAQQKKARKLFLKTGNTNHAVVPDKRAEQIDAYRAHVPNGQAQFAPTEGALAVVPYQLPGLGI